MGCKYTFLLPAYKVQFLQEMLESIKNQTYEDFRCIVSDDASPYDVKKVYDNVVGGDKRFSYRRNEVNYGGDNLVSHWNFLLGLCDTEYFVMSSDDDVYDSSFLAEIDKATLKYPGLDLYRARTRVIDDKGRVLIYDSCYDEYMDCPHFFRKHFCDDFVCCEANYVYRTHTMKEKGGYMNLPKAWGSDVVAHLMMSEKGIAVTRHVLFDFRISGVNISSQRGHRKDSESKMNAVRIYYYWVKGYISVIPKSEEIQLLDFAYSGFIRNVLDTINTYLPYCGLKMFFSTLTFLRKELNISKVRLIVLFLSLCINSMASVVPKRW